MARDSNLEKLRRRVHVLTLLQSARALGTPAAVVLGLFSPELVETHASAVDSAEIGMTILGFVSLLSVLWMATVIAGPFVENPRYTKPLDVTLAFFVPISNLYRPYQMVKAVDRALAEATGGKGSPYILVWWIVWLGHTALSQVLMAIEAPTLDWVFGALALTLAMSVAHVLLGWHLLGRAQRLEDAGGAGLDGPAVAAVFR